MCVCVCVHKAEESTLLMFLLCYSCIKKKEIKETLENIQSHVIFKLFGLV